jgi:signal transduction histidine kinase/ligand-binding sensor domain-containing protein
MALVCRRIGVLLSCRELPSSLAAFSASLALIVIVLLMLSTTSAQAQQADLQDQRPEFSFDHALSTDGMSFNGSFFQDQEGFFWIATQSGLFKWDGYNLTKPKGLPENAYCAYEDRESLIWIVSPDGLSVYDKATDSITAFKHDPEDPTSIAEGIFNSTIQPICEDSAGNIWLGTQGGLSKYDREAKTFTAYVHDPDNLNSLADNDVLAVWVDREDKVWVGTRGGLDELAPATGVFSHHQNDPGDPTTLSSNNVIALLEDSNGILWAGTEDKGLNRIDKNTGRVTRYLHDPNNPHSLVADNVYSITEARPDELWITSTSGLDILEVKSGTAYHYDADPGDPDSLSSSNARNVYTDRLGIIWVVHFAGILDKVDTYGRKFALYQNDPQNANSLAGNVVSDVYEDKQGMIWFGLLGLGLDRYDRTTKTFTHYPNAPGGTCTDMFEDGDGLIWITGAAGIFSFDKLSGTYSQVYPLDSQWGTVIVPDRNHPNILWVGTDTGGLVKFDTITEKVVLFRHNPSDPKSVSYDSIWDLFMDDAGFIWIPTEGAGLDKFDPGTGEVVAHYTHDPNNPGSLGSDDVYHVYQDSAGRIWVGTNGGGLETLNADGTFTRFDQANGLPTNVVANIIEDNQGLLWLGTKIGLIRFDPNTGVSRVYTKDDGLQGNQFWEFPVHKASDGEIWEWGGNGANSFYPDRLTDNSHKPPVFFTALTQGGEPLKDLGAAPERVKEIRLNWRSNFFEFEVAALDFTRPQKNQYEYILEGFDKTWYKAGTKHSGRYSGLPSGTYTLRVRGSNNDGIWSDSEAVLKVTVVGPFWRATWFIALLAVVAAGTVAGFLLLRMHAAVQRRRNLEQQVAERTVELQQVNDELEAFAYSVSHDLQTPLRAVSGFSEILATRHSGGLNEEGRHYLDNVIQAGGRMQLLIDDLLEYSRLGRARAHLKPVALRDLLARISVELTPRAQEAGATIEIADDLPVVEGDETLLGEVFANLLDNALEYRRPDVPARITVTSRLEGDTAVIAVADNGIGIPPENFDQIFDVFQRLHGQDEYQGTGIGLATVKKSLQMLKGSVSVESEVGGGSTFFVRLPRCKT